MGQVESYQGGPILIDAEYYQRSIQMFNGLRPQLLQQLEDLRGLLQSLAGLHLGLDPIMDPDCTVHDAVSSLLSQYIEKVGSLSSAPVTDDGALTHSGVPSQSHQPHGSSSGPHFIDSRGTLHGAHPAPALQASGFPFQASASSSAGTRTISGSSDASSASSASTASERSSGASSWSTSAASSTHTGAPIPPAPFHQRQGPEDWPLPAPQQEQERRRTVKRPMKRFSTAKWVSAVVRAMALTSDKSELDRLEAGLEALARAEHDWLAARLQAVAGGTMRLPPSHVEEVTAVGLAVWVEFWNTWAGRTLAQSGSTGGSSMQGLSRSRPGSGSIHRVLRRTLGSGQWCGSSGGSSSNGSFAEREREREGAVAGVHQRSQGSAKWRSNSLDREATSAELLPPSLDIPARSAPWKASNPPLLSACIEADSPIQPPQGALGRGDPHAGFPVAHRTEGPESNPAPSRTLPAAELSSKLPSRFPDSGLEGGGGFDRLPSRFTDSSIEGGGGFNRLAMKPEMHEEAAFFNIDLGTLGSARTPRVPEFPNGQLFPSAGLGHSQHSPALREGTVPGLDSASCLGSHGLRSESDYRQAAGRVMSSTAKEEACQPLGGAAGWCTLEASGQGDASCTEVHQQDATARASHPPGQCRDGYAGGMSQPGVTPSAVDEYAVEADRMRVQAQEMKEYALRRALDRENGMRADIGNRLQGTLLEEFLLETSRCAKGLEAAPPSHADIVRLLGLAASSAHMRQVSAAVCVLRLLDGLGREWRGGGEGREAGWEHGPPLSPTTLAAAALFAPALGVPSLNGTSRGGGIEAGSASLSAGTDATLATHRGATLPSGAGFTGAAASLGTNLGAAGAGLASLGDSLGAAGSGKAGGALGQDWDRYLEARECRGFVLQCLVDLIEACALACKARKCAGRVPSLGSRGSAGGTPTGRVTRLRSLGEDELEVLESRFSHLSSREGGGAPGEGEGASGGGGRSGGRRGGGGGGVERGGGRASRGEWEGEGEGAEEEEEDGEGEGEGEGEGGPTMPCPATLVELSEASLVWRTRHRRDLNEAQKLRALDTVLQKPRVGPGILALAVADEAQGLRHLSTQDLRALADRVEDLGSIEAAFRLRLRAAAGEYEDLDSVVDIVGLAFLTRGIESVPLRLKRLVDTARFALTHAPSAPARHAYAMTFSACLLVPLMEDPGYPFAFEVADSYVGLTGLFGPAADAEEEEVQLRTKLLCAKVILKTVVEPLLVETEDDGEGNQQGLGATGTKGHSRSSAHSYRDSEHSHSHSAHSDSHSAHSDSESNGEGEDDLSQWLSGALAAGKATSGLARELMRRLSDKAERDEREERERRKRRKERALRHWARGVDYPGIELGWRQWQAIGLLLQSLNPGHAALVTMWAKAVRGNFKAINEEGSSSDKEAVALFDWGLEGLLCAFACDPEPGTDTTKGLRYTPAGEYHSTARTNQGASACDPAPAQPEPGTDPTQGVYQGPAGAYHSTGRTSQAANPAGAGAVVDATQASTGDGTGTGGVVSLAEGRESQTAQHKGGRGSNGGIHPLGSSRGQSHSSHTEGRGSRCAHGPGAHPLCNGTCHWSSDGGGRCGEGSSTDRDSTVGDRAGNPESEGARRQRCTNGTATVTASGLQCPKRGGLQGTVAGSGRSRKAQSVSYLWVENLEREVGPRERDRGDLLLAVGGRMASTIFWKWGQRKESQKYIARLLLYAHSVVGLSALQRARAARISQRIWGWMLPNASAVREQCETDEEASEVMENAIYATWLGAAGS